jgi:hypothetical protein
MHSLPLLKKYNLIKLILVESRGDLGVVGRIMLINISEISDLRDSEYEDDCLLECFSV